MPQHLTPQTMLIVMVICRLIVNLLIEDVLTLVDLHSVSQTSWNFVRQVFPWFHARTQPKELPNASVKGTVEMEIGQIRAIIEAMCCPTKCVIHLCWGHWISFCVVHTVDWVQTLSMDDTEKLSSNPEHRRHSLGKNVMVFAPCTSLILVRDGSCSLDWSSLRIHSG